MVGIIKEFLEEILQEELTAFTLNPGSNLGDGHTGLLTSIEVTLKSTKVLHLLLKSFPMNRTRQEFSMKSNIFYKELRVYDTLIPAFIQLVMESTEVSLKPPFPKFFWGRAVNYTPLAGADFLTCSDPLENCILMEDLRKTENFRLLNRFAPFDFPHAELVIAALAKFHALSWALKTHHNLNNLSQMFPFIGERFFDLIEPGIFTPLFDNAAVLFRDAVEASEIEQLEKEKLLTSIERGREMALDMFRLYNAGGKGLSPSITKDSVLRIQKEILPGEVAWETAIHQDVHVNNLLFKYKDEEPKSPLEVKLIDLQGVTEGDPMVDLAKFIYNSTTSTFRRNHLTFLLTLYHDTFMEICDGVRVEPPQGFNLHEIQRRFHRSKVFGFTTCMMGLPFILNEPKDATDLDGMCQMESVQELYAELAKSSNNVRKSSIFNMRVLDLVQDLYAEGVI